MDKDEFVGSLMTFGTKDDAEIVDANLMLEVTQFTQDGRVEIGFTDRNERCYLKFPLHELLRHVALARGEKL